MSITVLNTAVIESEHYILEDLFENLKWISKESSINRFLQVKGFVPENVMGSHEVER